jgi:uncharacterized protein (DUF488 family)
MIARTFELYTIGYEGSSVEDFIDTLLDVEIDHVVDVRDIPLSRKPGFSKTALSERLASAGIAYTHLRALGDPPEGRAAMRAGDRDKFLRVFAERLATMEAQSALRDLLQIAEGQSAVLLCFERDPKECHRSIVAKQIQKDGAVVKNIGVRQRKYAERREQPNQVSCTATPN